MPTIYSDKIKVNCTLVHDENGYYHLIYKIVNTVNRKIYVGKHSTKNPYDNYMGSGIAIISAIEKYGIENFSKEILFCFTNEKEAFLKESEIVNENFVKRSNTYNMMCGGEGVSSGENNPMYGRRGENSPNYGEKNGMYGKHLPQETRDKISKANKGKFVGEKNPNYGNGDKIKGKKNPMYGKHHSIETRKKLSEMNKGENNPFSKAVQKIDIDGNIVIEYQTITECRKMEHIGFRNLAKLIANNYQRHGYYYRYKEKHNE